MRISDWSSDVCSSDLSCCLLRCAVIHRRNRLPLHRLATLDDLAVGGVVLEERRQPIALAEHRRVLQVEVQVRFAGVAAVAAAAGLVPGGDLLAGLDRTAAPAPGGGPGVILVAQVEAAVVDGRSEEGRGR